MRMNAPRREIAVVSGTFARTKRRSSSARRHHATRCTLRGGDSSTATQATVKQNARGHTRRQHTPNCRATAHEQKSNKNNHGLQIVALSLLKLSRWLCDPLPFPTVSAFAHEIIAYTLPHRETPAVVHERRNKIPARSLCYINKEPGSQKQTANADLLSQCFEGNYKPQAKGKKVTEQMFGAVFPTTSLLRSARAQPLTLL